MTNPPVPDDPTAPKLASNYVAPILTVLGSRKFWFQFITPILISTIALALQAITPTAYIAAITATSAVYGASVAYEDAHQN